MPDKIAEYGGGLCDCFAGGCGMCMYVYFCTPCAYAEYTTDAGVGNGCAVECLLAYCLPCFIPMRMGEVNAKLGGGDDCCSRLAFQCCCGCFVCPCAICQYGRAVKNAGKLGLLHPFPNSGGGGVPAPQQQQEMYRQQQPPQVAQFQQQAPATNDHIPMASVVKPDGTDDHEVIRI